jgi:drug/metabolite transporter (DMT)-like permease
VRAGLAHLLASERACKVMLVTCAAIWGFSFLVAKDAVNVWPVFWLLAVRFGIAALALFLVFHRRIMAHLDRTTIRVGLMLGLFEWLGYAFQTVGLVYTTPGKNAFLTGCYCVLVPFCAWLWGMGKPERYHVIAALLCLFGLGMVALDNGFPLNIGDLFTLVGAFFYALQMVEVSRSGPTLDIVSLSTWQFVAMAVPSLVCALLFEQAPPAEVLEPGNVLSLLFLAIVCSSVCLSVMNYGFTKVDPTSGSLLSSLESPFGVLFSVLFAGEVLTGRLVLGFVLIFLAIVYSEGGLKLVLRLRGTTQD